MSARVLTIIATGEKEKVLTGLMYTKNALENDWLEDIKLIFFGPSESLLVDDEKVQKYVSEISDRCECMACKYISDREEISDKIEGFGVEVEYVGSVISEYIDEGYVPMIW